MARMLLILLAVVVAAVAVVACSPIRALNAIVSSDSYELTTDAYGAGERRRLDVYTPRATAERVRPANGWPMVVFFYGGSWNRGERQEYRFVGEAMAARGIVTVIPDYRLYPEVRYPDFLKDNAAAMAWSLREAARLGADPKRVFVMGHSAGGYNAAMVALDPRWLKAEGAKVTQLAGWIGLAGPYDFLPIENPDARPVFFHPNSPPESQPIRYVAARAPRAFLGAAPEDTLVNPERNTRQMATKLQAAGVPVTMQFYPRTSHVTLIGAFAAPLRFLAPVLEDVVEFVKTAPPR
ncbi:MAG TPA: alpha/beta hydrolase [Burkholderiaceae bacterium]|nr:alpha/beta hydrolase [Burkholderiaceae bacterium]